MGRSTRPRNAYPKGACPFGTYALRLSPDGTRIALDIRDQENDIWIWDLEREILSRLTLDPATDIFPVWTNNSLRVVFSSNRFGDQDLFWQAADRAGTAERLASAPNSQLAMSVTPDGQLVVSDQGSNIDLSLMSLDGKANRRPLLGATPAAETGGEVSPDGRWLAYSSNESGPFEVYVRSFADPNSGQTQISNGGGTKPMWAPTGGELFYVDAESVVISVPVTGTGAFGNPVRLFEARLATDMQSGRFLDVARDGRFLMIKDALTDPNKAGGSPPPSMVVVLNWFEELKQRLPAK